mgnify:CR=1 FL=1
MPWDIKYITKPGYTLIRYKGIVTENELIDAFQASKEIINQKNSSLILSDCSTMEGGHSVFDLYKLIKLYEETGFPRNFKEAILMPELRDSVDNVLFYETACLNRGYNVKICREHDEAVAWLFG